MPNITSSRERTCAVWPSGATSITGCKCMWLNNAPSRPPTGPKLCMYCRTRSCPMNTPRPEDFDDAVGSEQIGDIVLAGLVDVVPVSMPAMFSSASMSRRRWSSSFAAATAFVEFRDRR